MITNIVLENFKCFRKVEINPRLITVFVGPNGTGKSSVLQALALLKQSVNEGNIRPHGTLVDQEIASSVASEDAVLVVGFGGTYDVPSSESKNLGNEVKYRYLFELEQNERYAHRGAFSVKSSGIPLSVEFHQVGGDQEISMPGVRVRVRQGVAIGQVAQLVKDLDVPDEVLRDRLQRHVFNAPARVLEALRLVSAARGLVRATYGLGDAQVADISLTSGLSRQEDQVATNLAYARELEDTISEWLRGITGVGIRGRMVPARSVAVESITVHGGVNIVAEGFGANSLVQLFMQIAGAVRGATVLIEEPEIHLHPKAQAELASLLAEVAKAESKQLIMTTHSEHIVGRLLTLVAEKKLSTDELAIYAFEKDEQGVCSVNGLEVSDDGRVTGGIKDFFETNLDELDRFVRALQSDG